MAIRVITRRGQEIGSLSSFLRPVKVAYVGRSRGKEIEVRNHEVERSSLSDSDIDTFTTDEVRKVNRVSLNPDDNINVFIPDTDYKFNEPNEIEWLNNLLGVPELEGEVITTGGSGLGTTAYNYKIVALGTDGTTAASTAVTLQGSGASASHKLMWNKIPFATGYILYDSTANARVAIISNPNTTQFIRTDNTATAATIPTVTTAKRKPEDDSEYYVDYNKVEYDYTVKNYTSLNQVQTDHGSGSDLTNMARIVFQYFRVPEMYLIAVDGTNNQAYIDAIDKLSAIDDVQYVTALKDSDVVSNYVATHAFNNSKDTEEKERFGIVQIPSSISNVGNETTAGTVRYVLAQFNKNKRVIIPVPNGNKVYMNTYQEEDGSFTDNKEVGNYFISGAICAAAVVAEDVATSIIGVTIPGFNYGPNGAPWNDSVEKDKIRSSGGMYILNKNGSLVIYNDDTNDTSTTENNKRSVLSAEDELRRRLRASHSQYLGRKITRGLLNAIYQTTTAVAKQMVADILINSFNEGSLEVIQDEISKTRVNVKFRYGAIYPLEELVFTYSFDL